MRRGEGRVERGGRRRGVKGYGDEREVRGREGEGGYIVEGEVCAPDSGPLSQRAAIAKVRGTCMQNRKTNTNPSPDPNRYRRRCPDPNARIQKFIHYMAIATFAIAALCDSGLSPCSAQSHFIKRTCPSHKCILSLGIVL